MADRQNFTWGVQGKGAQGVDYGNTADWNDQQWNDYQAKNGGPQSTSASSTPAPAAPSGPPAPITNAQGVTGTQATVGGATAPGAPTTVAQSFQQALVNRMNPQAASASSGTVAPAIEANKLSEQRGFERNRNMLAERNATVNGGAPNGGFETNLLGLAQDRAGREGAFAGNAVMQEQDRLDRNQTGAMGMTGSMLSGNQANELQRYGMDTDASLRREGLGAQTTLGNRDIDLRGRLGEGQLNLGLLSALMGNDQFGRSLTQNGQQFGASLDQNGLMGLLGLL